MRVKATSVVSQAASVVFLTEFTVERTAGKVFAPRGLPGLTNALLTSEGVPGTSVGMSHPSSIIVFAGRSIDCFLSQCPGACFLSCFCSNEPGPDFADYPYDTVPNKVDQLFRAQRHHDRRQNDVSK